MNLINEKRSWWVTTVGQKDISGGELEQDLPQLIRN